MAKKKKRSEYERFIALTDAEKDAEVGADQEGSAVGYPSSG
jgi:hypothetical protein